MKVPILNRNHNYGQLSAKATMGDQYRSNSPLISPSVCDDKMTRGNLGKRPKKGNLQFATSTSARQLRRFSRVRISCLCCDSNVQSCVQSLIDRKEAGLVMMSAISDSGNPRCLPVCLSDRRGNAMLCECGSRGSGCRQRP